MNTEKKSADLAAENRRRDAVNPADSEAGKEARSPGGEAGAGACPASGRGLMPILDLGAIDYASGLTIQERHRDEVLADRDAAREYRTHGFGEPCHPGAGDSRFPIEDTARRAAPPREIGRLLLLEHAPPVITVSRRPAARRHLLASPAQLARCGVELCETDRGGDITYHGPGQLVAYPILDLNRLGLNLHGYLRFLEEIVIAVCESFGVSAFRDVCATGVWVGGESAGSDAGAGECARQRQARRPAQLEQTSGAKICAMGVRVRRWVTTHGLALNVNPDLSHFQLIVPCGLAGRPVTSLHRVLGDRCPAMQEVKSRLAEEFLAASVRRLQSSHGAGDQR